MLLLVAMVCPILLTACDLIVSDPPVGEYNPDLSDTADGNGQTLQILKSNAKLTQDQLLSRIKAEHLIENGGYADSDPIVAIITLPGASLMDDYISKNVTGSVSDYVKSDEGRAAEEIMLAEQRKLTDELYAEGLISEVAYSYSTIMNGVAVHTTYGNFKKIAEKNNRERSR